MDKVKVIFLDIDGVLQPTKNNGNGKRFEINRDNLIESLSSQHNIDYRQYSQFDVAAVYCDWDLEAINIIKRVLKKTGAKIVISSDWRDIRKPNKMRDLLRIHGLDEFYIGDTPQITEIPNYWEQLKMYSCRVAEIMAYVEKNKETIDTYVAIDDLDLTAGGFSANFIHTDNLITEEQGNQCEECLTEGAKIKKKGIIANQIRV